MARTLLFGLLGTTLVVGAGLVGRELLFARGPQVHAHAAAVAVAVAPPLPTSAAAVAPPAPELEARVNEVTGNAEVFVPGEGRWRPVSVGQMLGPDAVLRTKQGRVVFGIGPGVTVSVSPSSQFRLRELSTRLSKVRLEGGHVTANVDGNANAELVLQVLGSDAEARTRDGEMAVLHSAGGRITVASSRGQTQVSSAGSAVVVKEGQQSEVTPGSPPHAPAAIPGNVFIKLSQGQARKLSQRSTLVEGETTPGAQVSINGVEATTNGGHFSVTVPLREGDNALDIVARDVLGRRSSKRVGGINVDSQPPMVKGKVRW
ncbi:MAG: hypothetical protein RL033_3310 [Pseudomonadota bacterium]|jgi:hypothetical protein